MQLNFIELITLATFFLGFLQFIIKRIDATQEKIDNTQKKIDKVSLEQKFIITTIKLLSKDMRRVKKKLKLE